MRFPCQFHNAKGVQCEKPALWRLHFSKDHPFSHTDCCSEHLDEYQNYSWLQDIGALNDYTPEGISKQ